MGMALQDILERKEILLKPNDMNTREMYEYHKKHIDCIADQYRLKEYTEQIIASIDELVSGNVSINDASLEIISACALISDNLLWDTDKIDDHNFDIIIKKIENSSLKGGEK